MRIQLTFEPFSDLHISQVVGTTAAQTIGCLGAFEGFGAFGFFGLVGSLGALHRFLLA